jgi:hypothetical protein
MWSRPDAVTGSDESGPAMTWSTAAVSATVRVTAPAMSAPRFSGTTPDRLTRPIVDRRPTSAWCAAGPRIESPVSLARPNTAKLAAAPAADPPLDPAVTRLVS